MIYHFPNGHGGDVWTGNLVRAGRQNRTTSRNFTRKTNHS